MSPGSMYCAALLNVLAFSHVLQLLRTAGMVSGSYQEQRQPCVVKTGAAPVLSCAAAVPLVHAQV
jgi:hypothetical protein